MSSTLKGVICLYAVFTLVIANKTTPQLPSSTAIYTSCDGLRHKLGVKRFPDYQVLTSDDHLDICVNNRSTCCSRQMELELYKVSGDDLLRIRTVKTDLIRKIFSEGQTKFNDFFIDLINESEEVLHNKFLEIYKNSYANNSHIFKAFYSNLRKYYHGGEVGAEEIIKTFFREILKKVFLLLNKRVNVNLDCVGLKLDTLNPFGGVPRRLTSQIERSFTAARTFVHGLTIGKTVVDKLTEAKLTNGCWKSVTKMSHCSLCDGHNNLKPCAGYCKRVYSDCFASLLVLEKVWDHYLEKMQLLSEKLEGAFNIEAVASQLPYDISGGIMTYQKASSSVSPKIMKGCNKTKNRVGRALVSSDSDFFLENKQRVIRSLNFASDKKSSKRATKRLDSLTRKYRDHLKRLKMFWSKLPDTMCDQTLVAKNITDRQCWNGSGIINNTMSAQDYILNRPIMNGNSDATIKPLISELRNTIKHLTTASKGLAVDLKIRVFGRDEDDDDEDFSGSGSGISSGSGSGENRIPVDVISTETIQSTDNSAEVTKPALNTVDQNDPNVRNLNGEGSYFSSSIFLLIAVHLLHVIM